MKKQIKQQNSTDTQRDYDTVLMAGSVTKTGFKLIKKQLKLDKLKEEVKKLEGVINDLKIVSRQRCPVNQVCQCGAGGNWDGICKISS